MSQITLPKIEDVKQWLEVAVTIVMTISTILGYKLLIYDARKRKAEVTKTGEESEKIHAEADKTHSEARKTDAETLDLILKSSTELINIYKDVIEKMEKERDNKDSRNLALESRVTILENQLRESNLEKDKEIKELKDILDTYTRGVDLLITQIKEMNIEPAWTPESEEG